MQVTGWARFRFRCAKDAGENPLILLAVGPRLEFGHALSGTRSVSGLVLDLRRSVSALSRQFA